VAETVGTIIGVMIVFGMLLTPPALIVLLIVWLVRRGRRSAERTAPVTHSVGPDSRPLPKPSTRNESNAALPSARGPLPTDTASDIAKPPSTRRETLEAERRNLGEPLAPEINLISSQSAAPVTSTPRFAQSSTTPAARVPNAVPTQKAKRPRVIRTQKAEWIPFDTTIEICGYVIAGGLLYVGRGLAAQRGSTEPALIDPSLKVRKLLPDSSGSSLGYWPSYNSITPEARAAYLSWLADGRRNPTVPLGYVFLFMYGLERRVLFDRVSELTEVSQIRDEMIALQKVYSQKSRSFESYARHFVELLDLVTSEEEAPGARSVPELVDDRWTVPVALRLQLGSYAKAALPLPQEWAFAWAWFNPEVKIRTAGIRCAMEYRALFDVLYREEFGDGMIVKPLKGVLSVSYRPASAGIDMVSVTLAGVSDVFVSAKPTEQLREISDQAQEALAAYSRYSGKNPDKKNSLEALALLPEEILAADNLELQEFHEWASSQVLMQAPLPVAELLQWWGFDGRERLTKKESIPILQLLEKLGVGVEPDVRFGGPPFAAQHSIILFDHSSADSVTATAEYDTAQTLSHLALAVSTADGQVAAEETASLVQHIEISLGLSESEQVRLHAHLRWLASGEVKLTGLAKRMAALSQAQRDGMADLLIRIAVSDGVVTPEEITILMKVFPLLGRDRNEVAGLVHATLAGSARTGGRNDQPVTVRRAESRRPGQRIPAQAADVRVGLEPVSSFALDTDIIRTTIQETARVSALLRDVFTDEDPAASDAKAKAQSPENDAQLHTEPGPPPSDLPNIGALDHAHSELFRILHGREEITLDDFEEHARHLGVMPNGALDTLNEAALDATDEPLLEGDETLAINSYTFKEMMK